MMPSKPRVLVIDDDRLIADTLTLVFRANGFESEARYSALDGLERCQSFEPELLLCDVNTPNAGTLLLTEGTVAEMSGYRILMLTAPSRDVPRLERYTARCPRPLRLLSKPCRPELLLKEARALLASASASVPLAGTLTAATLRNDELAGRCAADLG